MQKGDSIIKFSGEHYFLDNFYKCRVTYDGITYRSSEAAFQAQKAPAEERHRFAELDSPAAVKKLGGKHGPYAMKQGSPELIAWQKRSPEVMEEVVRAKFTQNPDLAEKLIATGDLHLIEGNNHDDNLYGIQLKRVPGTRKKLLVDEDGCYILSQEENEHNNRLGKILMKIRDELKQTATSNPHDPGNYLIAESEHYCLEGHYEIVSLCSKKDHKVITTAGDFYGDCDVGLIDKNERFCVMAGCGYIVYYLKEPFTPYEYDSDTDQWTEDFRDGSKWFESVRQMSDDQIEIVDEYGNKMKITV